jgi:hypothetical protein
MALVITTTSSSTWMDDRANAIYPAFVDNLAYTSWRDPALQVTPTVSNSSFAYFEFKATGGAVVLWEVISGALPRGLTLDGATGRVSGTPNKIGDYTFTLRATSASETVTKTITWTAHPYRARWVSEILFAPVTQWSKINAPLRAKNFFDVTKPDGVNEMIPEFEAQVVLDAEADAQYDFDLGIKYREAVCAVDQGNSRMDISEITTRYNDHASVDHLKNYIDAYHAKGIKVGAYVAPNFEFNKIPGETGAAAYALTDGDIPFGNWAGPSKAFMERWIRLGLDLAVIDVGAASDYYVAGFANPGVYQWDLMLPYWRWYNPFFCFGVNPGTRTGTSIMGGTQVLYPHADVYVFEQTKTPSTNAITSYEVGTPPSPRKKVAIYQWQIPSPTFGYSEESVGDPLKDIPGTIKMMEAGWENGCTFAAAHPVSSTGEYPTPYFQSYFETLAAHAAASGGYSSFVELDYQSGRVSMTGADKETIYYTTDGSRPSLDSMVYTEPIKISKPTLFRARTKHPDKLLGHVEEAMLGTELEIVSTSRVAFKNVPNVVHAVDTGDFYRGMTLFVFNEDIIVDAFGRAESGTLTHSPDLLIKRRADEFFHYLGNLPSSTPAEDGWHWLEVPGIRLKAGSPYWIAFKEGTIDTYASNVMTQVPLHRDEFRIKGNAIGAPRGDIIPLNANFHWYAQWSVGGDYDKGQFINMRYRTVGSNVNKDLLLGRDANMYTNAGGAVSVNGGIHVATHANNDLPLTYAAAGGVYPWTWEGLLSKPAKISRVEVEFFTGFSTEIELHGTINAFHSAGTLLGKKLDNRLSQLTFTFPPRYVNRIYLKSLKPDGPDQIGGGMILKSVKAYTI